jgi:hypothetical protein
MALGRDIWRLQNALSAVGLLIWARLEAQNAEL